MAAQLPTQVQLNALNDEVLLIIKEFLLKAEIREGLTFAYGTGAWEIWLQVELARYLNNVLKDYTIHREQAIYTQKNQHVDLWAEPSPIRSRNSWSFPFAIELKVAYTTNTVERAAGGVLKNMVEDIKNITSGTRQLDPTIVARHPRVYCIGFTHLLDDVRKTESKFPLNYIEVPFQQTADQPAGMRYFLVWWRQDY